jgi:uncharacterized membrane protein YdjX (TVP38/TMEM64 family)
MSNQVLTESNNYSRIILIFIIALGGILFYVTGLYHFFSLEAIKLYEQQVRVVVDQYYKMAVVCYLIIYAGLILFNLPVASVMTFVGGFFFGSFFGALYALCGATAGATATLYLLRYIAKQPIKKKYSTSLHRLNRWFDNYGLYAFVFLRALPIFPFFIVNIFASLTEMPVFQFVLLTFVGMAPATFLFAHIGFQLDQIESLRDVFSIQFFGGLLFIALFFMLLIALKKRLDRR